MAAAEQGAIKPHCHWRQQEGPELFIQTEHEVLTPALEGRQGAIHVQLKREQNGTKPDD